MRIGAHVTISKGLVAALEKAKGMGADCIQIFSSPPQSFDKPKFTTEDCRQFREVAKTMDIGPVFIHAKYLINLGSEKTSLRDISQESLIADLRFGHDIGASGVIVHTGSHKGKGLEEVLPWVVSGIQRILKETPDDSRLLLEVAAGNGKIGALFTELQTILDEVQRPRIGVCLDTAHLFANGYAFDTEAKLQGLHRRIEETVGLHTISCIHTNDSKVPFQSYKDRHENIGKGFIGREAFRLLLHDPHLSTLPFIIETPGFDDKGPDKENLDILKSLI